MTANAQQLVQPPTLQAQGRRNECNFLQQFCFGAGFRFERVDGSGADNLNYCGVPEFADSLQIKAVFPRMPCKDISLPPLRKHPVTFWLLDLPNTKRVPLQAKWLARRKQPCRFQKTGGAGDGSRCCSQRKLRLSRTRQ